MSHRPPTLQAEKALEVIRILFGSANWQIGLQVILLLLSFNAVSNSVYEISRGEFSQNQWGWILFFLLVVVWLYWSARKALARINLVIVQDENPQKCKALVLFLSPPGKDVGWLTQDPREETRGSILQEDARKKFEGSWRMPMEAVAYHLERLKKIVILPSSDSPQKLGMSSQEDGTFRNLDLFKRTVLWFVGDKKPGLQLVGLSELNSQWNAGVDFENAQALVDVLEQAFDWLHNQQITDYEIMVDITGGQKVPTVAGAAVALGEGRRFQYVSTRDYKVRTYDITYQATS